MTTVRERAEQLEAWRQRLAANMRPGCTAHAPVMFAPPSGASSCPLLLRSLPSSRTRPHALQQEKWGGAGAQ